VQREISNTPLQALTLLNNEVFAEAAQGLAKRVLQESETMDRDRLIRALRYCIARAPNDREIERFQKLLDVSRQNYRDHSDDASRLVSKDYALIQIAPDEQAAWIATVRIILNLDEFVTRE
jgi:hypothetical protein